MLSKSTQVCPNAVGTLFALEAHHCCIILKLLPWFYCPVWLFNVTFKSQVPEVYLVFSLSLSSARSRGKNHPFAPASLLLCHGSLPLQQNHPQFSHVKGFLNPVHHELWIYDRVQCQLASMVIELHSGGFLRYKQQNELECCIPRDCL